MDKRLELSVEAIALQSRFRDLLEPAELASARGRLNRMGITDEVLAQPPYSHWGA